MTSRNTAVGLGLVAALAAGACTTGSGADSGGRPTSVPVAPPTAGPSPPIPQPTRDDILAVHPEFRLAPENERIDITWPTFSNPTKVTNPLFPVGAQASVLHLGTKDGQPLRTEVTTLPYTRVIDWDGQRVEVLVSQYNLFLDGRIEESAIDWYAQSDDGAVWYFGEDVANYADGAVADTNGTWVTGKDGPAALIMPGAPAVGQVFRPENIPGLVLEEVKITAVEQIFDGPRGPVTGGLVAGEVHKDGTVSDKLFAPGYGEFRSSSATELEEVSLVVPADTIPGPMPAPVQAIAVSAGGLFDAAYAKDWSGAGSHLAALRAAWDTVAPTDVPVRVRDLLNARLTGLAAAVAARDRSATGQLSIDALRLGLDLQLRHRPTPEVDRARMDVWSRQLQLDAAAADSAGVQGDNVALKYVRDRILAATDRRTLAQIDAMISTLEEVAADGDFGAVTETATALRKTIAAGL